MVEQFFQKYNWSYSPDYLMPSALEIEQTLKYGDIPDLKLLLEKYAIEDCIKVSEKRVLNDVNFERTNYFLERFIFNIDDDYDKILSFIRKHYKGRFDD
ncbi:MAG: hypothetical protein NT007_15910 [Candidatus Kapabacteria bacterium]|nr:hypothetical protein [Candidatus Kapabacteria bacterium]